VKGEKDMKFDLFSRFIFPIAITLTVTSCTTGLPTVNERSDVQSGKKSVVLLRITCELIEDNTPIEAFPGRMSVSVMILKGGPIIGGKVDVAGAYRFLSPETRKQGWVFIYLEPGIHYLVFEGMASAAGMYYSPRYEVKIPENSPVVYIGSMHLYCESPYIFETACGTFDKGRMIVSNEEIKAKKLQEEFLPDLGSFQTILMERL
jgi:hypothetical protein